VHGFRCYDNIARTRNVSECLYSLYAWFGLGGQFNEMCASLRPFKYLQSYTTIICCLMFT